MLSVSTAVIAGSWAVPSLHAKGFWSDVVERQGQAWKIHLHSYSVTSP